MGIAHQKRWITINPRKTGRDSAGHRSVMFDMAQSARKNVTPRSSVTRKNLPSGHSCEGRNPGQREMALSKFGLTRAGLASSTPCQLSRIDSGCCALVVITFNKPAGWASPIKKDGLPTILGKQEGTARDIDRSCWIWRRAPGKTLHR
jgi:hypothetical protein